MPIKFKEGVTWRASGSVVMSGSDSVLVRWYEDNEVIRPAYWLRYPKLAEESEPSTMLICVYTCSPAIKARPESTMQSGLNAPD